MKLYKILVDGCSCHNSQNKMAWDLPEGKRPGKWHEVKGYIIPCENGLHLTDYDHIGIWFMPGCQIFEVETRGKCIRSGDKWVAGAVRLIKSVPMPDYLLKAFAFVDTVKNIPFFKPTKPPKPEWKFFETWDAAWRASQRMVSRDKARKAAWNAAQSASLDVVRVKEVWIEVLNTLYSMALDSVLDKKMGMVRLVDWDIADSLPRDMELMVQVEICDNLSLDQKHITCAKNRWEVWQMGYALLCEVDDVLYVYKRESEI